MEHLKTMWRILGTVLLLVIFALPSAAYTVGDWTVVKLTDNISNDVTPQVSGRTVVWSGWVEDNGTHIFMWRDGVTTQLSTESIGNWQPRISGDIVAWQGASSYGGIVFYYDGSVQQVTYSWEQHGNPYVSRGNVAWLGEGGGSYKNLYYFDGVDLTQVTDTDVFKNDLHLSGSSSTWQEPGSAGNGDIFYYDGVEVIQLTDDAISDSAPRISDDGAGDFHLTYERYLNGYLDIMHFDGTTTINLSNTPDLNELDHQTCGDRTVWRVYDGQYELWLYDGSTAAPIYTSGSSISDPQVSESVVTWEGSAEIFVFDGSEVTRLTDNGNTFCNDPKVDGDTIVWNGRDEDNDFEIYMAYKTESVAAVVPDAQSLTVSGARPNPFNPSTEIMFTNSRAEAVSVRIFDMRGRLVTDLGERIYEAGEHAVAWHGQDQRGESVPSGVYFYQVTSGTQRQVGKLALVE